MISWPPGTLWPPALVLYVPLHWIWPRALGRSFLPFLVLLDDQVPGRADEAAILRHELQHQRQGWRYLWIGFWVLYTLSPKWRKRFEAEAVAAE